MPADGKRSQRSSVDAVPRRHEHGGKAPAEQSRQRSSAVRQLVQALPKGPMVAELRTALAGRRVIRVRIAVLDDRRLAERRDRVGQHGAGFCGNGRHGDRNVLGARDGQQPLQRRRVAAGIVVAPP
jgi:hypothetical protein